MSTIKQKIIFSKTTVHEASYRIKIILLSLQKTARIQAAHESWKCLRYRDLILKCFSLSLIGFGTLTSEEQTVLNTPYTRFNLSLNHPASPFGHPPLLAALVSIWLTGQCSLLTGLCCIHWEALYPWDTASRRVWTGYTVTCLRRFYTRKEENSFCCY